MTAPISLSLFVASHTGSGLNILSQTIAHKLWVLRGGVATLLATVTLAANSATLTQGQAAFSYTTAEYDLLYVTVTPSGLLTAGVTGIQNAVS